MAIPPNIKQRLDQLKAQAAMKAEMERRRAQAQENAQKSAQSLVPQQKAKGGLTKFLKDSKVKTSVYHGTESKDDYDDDSHGNDAIKSFAGRATWVAEEPYTAHGYSGKSGYLMPLHIKIKKPLTINHVDANDEAHHIYDLAKNLGVDVDHLKSMAEPESVWEVINHPYFIDAAAKAGFDGISINEGGRKTHAVFNPGHIKSAIGNRGTYDPKSPDITKASGGEVKTPSQDAMRLMLNKQGMYSPLEKSLMAVPRAKGTPAEFMAEASKQPGFRAEEVADRKIALPQQKMTKAQMLAALQQNHPMPQVEVMIKGGAHEDDLKERAIEIAYDEARKILGPAVSDSPYGPSAVQEMANGMLEENMRNYMNLARDEMGTEEGFHEDYTLPGGENYREILLKKPEFKGDKQIRNLELELNRVPPEKRVEIMRKITALKDEKERHGEVFSGNPSHFGGEPAILASIRVKDRRGPNGEKILHVEEIQSDWHQKGRKEGYRENKEPMDPMKAQRMKDKIFERFDAGEIDREQRNALLDQLGELQDNGRKVPDAPFKKSWHEMALKHVLGMAAKGGYDGIAITPGAEQADRYDLSKHIGEIAYDPIEKRLAGKNHEGKLVVGEENVTPEKLADYIGKEAAEKIMQAQPSQGGVHRLSGLDLKVGGEGMKGFYDKIVPTYLNKLAKPHGVQVQMNAMPIKKGEKMVPDQAGLGQIRSGEPELANLHYLPINDAMRNKIKTEGLPQYRSGGDVQNFDNGGAAFGVFPQMKARRSQQDPVAAANMPVAGVLGTAAGAAGAIPDALKALATLANWSFGPGGVNISTEAIDPYTSEGLLQKMPLQEALQSPAGKAVSTLGTLVGGGLSGPAVSKLSELPTTLRLLGKEFPMEKAGTVQLIGEKSPAFNKFAKMKAEQMERAGSSMDEIKMETGLERALDGSWRQMANVEDYVPYTPEQMVSMGLDPRSTYMPKAFAQNPMEELYPDIVKNMYFGQDFRYPGQQTYMIPPSDGRAGRVMISDPSNIQRSLRHELGTHAVQDVEGWAPGASMASARETPTFEARLADIKLNPKDYDAIPGRTAEDKAAYLEYKHQHGEAEARMVGSGAFQEASPLERRSQSMYEFMDVPKEKLLMNIEGYQPKPVTNVAFVSPGEQTAISALDIAGQAAPEVQDHSFLDAFTGGGDQGPSDLSSFFNLMGAESPTDMSSLFGGGYDFGSYEGEDFAEGGSVGGPTVAQMKLALMKVNPANIKNLGVNEVLGQDPKLYFPADKQEDTVPPPGGVATPSGMPIGGVDMSQMQPGQQLMPQNAMQPQGGPQQPPGAPQAPGGAPAPAAAPGAPQGGQSNILQMTPQGQAMAAMTPNQPPQAPRPGMARGGAVKTVAEMKQELESKKDQPKRIQINAEGSGGVKGIVVPRHMWEGTKHAEGMKDVNEARAKVYGPEHRQPLTLGQIAATHKKTLNEHFSKPLHEQLYAENEALERLRAAKHIGKTANTLDESEKLDTVRHEHDEHGRTYVGYASKGTAGHALYTSGHGKDIKHHVINTCPGQTTGCGGGVDEKGIVDTKRGTCFAPNAESQYVNAAVRRASHEQAKHDPAMTKDWILAHTGSLRNAAEKADKKNQRTLFRPNVVDETDVSSRHVLRHLNKQRKQQEKPPIIANSYGKTNELHDPENGYYVTHSNVGPKVKKGQEISENIARDKQRVRSTIHAATASGDDLKNEEGNKTPPKNSYMVTDVKRGSPLSKKMEKHITHAKYWSTGREEHELSKDEREEGPEGHYSGSGRSTTPEKAHYGHITLKGKRYDYQKQHILHPRLVQVGKNDDGTPHMIPTDSRFKDEEFLPKNRFMTKNGKKAGAILMTTPTESTSNLGHQTSFTHHVNDKHIEHAVKNNGEYEIDSPHEQEKAKGKEYVAPQPIKFLAEGGSVGRHPELDQDDFHAFPERNFHAQYHLSRRHDPEDSGDDEYVRTVKHGKHRAHKKVSIHKNLDTMRLEMTKKA